MQTVVLTRIFHQGVGAQASTPNPLYFSIFCVKSTYKMNKEDYYLNKIKKLLDADQRIFDRPALPENPKTIHIIGVCGTAMGTLAGLLVEKGYKVSGSDQMCLPPISDMVEKLDVDLHIGNYQKENVENKDLIVIGNVARAHNPEVKFARENNLPQASMPETIRKYVFDKANRIVVAGTHGKTTTTGLLVKIFEVAGKDPGYMIGGVPQGKEKSFSLGKGDYAIFEGDEYNTAYFDESPKFLHYGAHSAIVTSLEFDHLDLYESFEDYKQAFDFFVNDLPAEGFLFLSNQYEILKEISNDTKAKVYFYGEKDSDISFENLRQENEYQMFDVIFEGNNLGEIKTPLSGLHNVYNILASVGVALKYNISFEDIQKAILEFRGMKRRQEILSNQNGIIVMDDFAHHPTAVKTTVNGVKNKFKNKRLIAVFEPSTRSSRNKIFEENYINAFNDADMVYFKIPKAKEADDLSGLIDGNYIVDELNKKNIESYFHNDSEEILNDLAPKLKEGDLVLVMSHGNFDGIRQKLIDKISK